MTPTDTKSETPRCQRAKLQAETGSADDYSMWYVPLEVAEKIESELRKQTIHYGQTKALLERAMELLECDDFYATASESSCTKKYPCNSCKLLSDYAALTNGKEEGK
jgi:hypothetical protein